MKGKTGLAVAFFALHALGLVKSKQPARDHVTRRPASRNDRQAGLCVLCCRVGRRALRVCPAADAQPGHLRDLRGLTRWARFAASAARHVNGTLASMAWTHAQAAISRGQIQAGERAGSRGRQPRPTDGQRLPDSERLTWCAWDRTRRGCRERTVRPHTATPEQASAAVLAVRAARWLVGGAALLARRGPRGSSDTCRPRRGRDAGWLGPRLGGLLHSLGALPSWTKHSE